LNPTLACRDLAAGYSDLLAFRHFDLDLSAGRITALLGPNGAGKTAILRTLSGLLPCKAGHLMLDGENVRRPNARRMNRAGVVLVPDSRDLFTRLSVRENLAVASPGNDRAVDDMIDAFPVLKDRARVAVRELSGGEQQTVTLARALVQRPRVLLIDEMSMGLSPVALDGLLAIVTRAAQEAHVAVLLVEQDVGAALEIADDVIVLTHGEIALAGPAATLRRDPTALQSAYFGAESRPPPVR
jgi:branched-chain amino acid transport system ATP-binding protein